MQVPRKFCVQLPWQLPTPCCVTLVTARFHVTKNQAYDVSTHTILLVGHGFLHGVLSVSVHTEIGSSQRQRKGSSKCWREHGGGNLDEGEENNESARR
jgi:hypothetical protein